MSTLQHSELTPRLLLAPDVTTLCQRAATQFIQSAAAAIRDHGAFYVALSGGSTPVYLHRTLAQPDIRQQIDWKRVHIYFGDERNVPPDHPDSNYRMARETLLTQVPVPPEQVHAVPTGCVEMQNCAQQYAQVLKAIPQQQGMPCFDLILLGMGNDGHTASLFPGTTILNERATSVAAVYVEKLATWRVSLTYPVLERAAAIMILVTGAEKAQILYEVINEPQHRYPIQQIHNERIEWYVDAPAAARLSESDVGLSG